MLKTMAKNGESTRSLSWRTHEQRAPAFALVRGAEASRTTTGAPVGTLPTNVGRSGFYPFLPGLARKMVDNVQPHSSGPRGQIFARAFREQNL